MVTPMRAKASPWSRFMRDAALASFYSIGTRAAWGAQTLRGGRGASSHFHVAGHADIRLLAHHRACRNGDGGDNSVGRIPVASAIGFDGDDANIRILRSVPIGF